MIPLSVAEAAAVLGVPTTGSGDDQALITSLTADSRQVGPGTLFVALPGERVDGHAYIESALAAGAAAALVAHRVGPGLQLVVDDPLRALGRLARDVVDRGRTGGLRVVGLTGSQGKTSTKDLLAQVLERHGSTVAPVGNLNNELGVPLTVGRVTPQTRFLVAEMGARGVGHIAYLCEIAPPDVGLVLNVGHAHIGEFGGREAIAKAKGELVEALPATGTAVLNAGDPLVWAMRTRTRATVLPYAVELVPDGPDAVWADDLVGDDRGRYSFLLHLLTSGQEQTAPVRLVGTGRHQVGNATAAAAVAHVLGVGLADVAAALSEAAPASRWRMEVTDRPDGVTVINDAYNANPDSMAAAVATLAEIADRRAGRSWAVLGDMLELGADAPDAHADLGRTVAAAGIDEVVAVGELADTVAQAAAAAGPAHVRVAKDNDEAVAWVTAGLRPGDVVLVKASRGLALDTVAEAILTPPAVPPPADETRSREDPPA